MSTADPMFQRYSLGSSFDLTFPQTRAWNIRLDRGCGGTEGRSTLGNEESSWLWVIKLGPSQEVFHRQHMAFTAEIAEKDGLNRKEEQVLRS